MRGREVGMGKGVTGLGDEGKGRESEDWIEEEGAMGMRDELKGKG